MGADQVGYLTSGPVQLDETRIAALKVRLSKAKDRIKVYYEADDTDQTDTDYDALMAALGDVLDEPYFEQVLDNAGCGLEGLPGEKEVDLFRDWWNGGHSGRDVLSRPDPINPGRVLVFAGEMTWGDTPSGHGYCTLNLLGEWNLLRHLDVL